MTIEEKAAKMDKAFNRLLSEVKDAKVIATIVEFIGTAEDKSKALLHDIIIAA